MRLSITTSLMFVLVASSALTGCSLFQGGDDDDVVVDAGDAAATGTLPAIEEAPAPPAETANPEAPNKPTNAPTANPAVSVSPAVSSSACAPPVPPSKEQIATACKRAQSAQRYCFGNDSIGGACRSTMGECQKAARGLKCELMPKGATPVCLSQIDQLGFTVVCVPNRPAATVFLGDGTRLGLQIEGTTFTPCDVSSSQ